MQERYSAADHQAGDAGDRAALDERDGALGGRCRRIDQAQGDCKGSVVKVDVSPNPVVVPDTLAAGLAPGRLVSFGVAMHGRKAMPFEVYKDNKGKNLVAWMTIGL